MHAGGALLCYDELILVRSQILLQFSVLIILVGSWIFIEAFYFSSGGIIVYKRTNQLKFSDCSIVYNK